MKPAAASLGGLPTTNNQLLALPPEQPTGKRLQSGERLYLEKEACNALLSSPSNLPRSGPLFQGKLVELSCSTGDNSAPDTIGPRDG